MVVWERPLGELCPGLEPKAALSACCRSRTGMLADDGARWAVLILPGGGYTRIAPAESEPVALAFAAAGMQAFTLSYSVLSARWPQPFLEGAAALAWLRAHGQDFGFRPDRVAVCGFSAGRPRERPCIHGAAGPGCGAGPAGRGHPLLPGGERGALPVSSGAGDAPAGPLRPGGPPPCLFVGHRRGRHRAAGEHPGLRPGAGGEGGPLRAAPVSGRAPRHGPGRPGERP